MGVAMKIKTCDIATVYLIYQIRLNFINIDNNTLFYNIDVERSIYNAIIYNVYIICNIKPI